MDPLRNPFSPGAGRRPPVIVGRNSILEAAQIEYKRAELDRSVRPLLLTGLRGTGKTVLLNEIKRNAELEGILVTRIEVSEDKSLPQLLCQEMNRILRILSMSESAKRLVVRAVMGLRNFAAAFRIKISDVQIEVVPEPILANSGDIELDLPELFKLIGQATKAAGKSWLLLIDEMQYIKTEELSALIFAVHQMSQDQLPVVFLGAGLPNLVKKVGQAKTYAERLFQFHQLNALSPEDTRTAVLKPLCEEGVTIDQEAIDCMVEGTKGYPFFIQEWAYKAWDYSLEYHISLEDIKNSYSETLISLDEGFFKVRMERLTPREIDFVHAMARLGKGPYQISDIAKSMQRTVSSIGPLRASIISKGMIFANSKGYLDFSVPLYDEFLRRSMSSE